MKISLLIIGILLTPCSIFAGINITGKLNDATHNTTLVAASVKALTTSDSTIKGVTQSDLNGHFNLNNMPAGDYLLEFSYLGYEKVFMTINNLNQDIDLGTIGLNEASEMLNEVVVKANRVTHKIDRQVILPSNRQVQASSNGLALLQNLQIDEIAVNQLEKTVKNLNNKPVQLRINGVEASIPEVVGIRPGDVIRVEYHDSPGLRYGHAEAVIDFIVRHKESGANFNLEVGNGVSRLGWGRYQVGGRYNNGKSSLQILGNINRRNLKWTRENFETYVYPDSVVSNSDIGEPTKAHFNEIFASLTYTYNNGERSLLNISLHNTYNHTPNSPDDRTSTLNRGNHIYHIASHRRSWEEIPSLNIYYRHSMGKDQKLYIDVVGTLMNSSTHHTFSSTLDNRTDNIQSDIKGNKQSVIGEVIYEKMHNNSKFTLGMKHVQSHMSNTYDGNIKNLVRMNTAETYAFAEFQSALGKLNYTTGLGLMHTFNSQDGVSKKKIIVRPTLTLAYKLCRNLFMRYKFYISGYSPSLSELSNVTQNIDTYQVHRGNPQLKTVVFYGNEFSSNWKCDFMNVNLHASYNYNHKPIMNETRYEANRFVRTYDNQRGFHRLNLSATINLTSPDEHFQVSLTPFFRRFISLGNSYTHTLNNWGFRGTVQAMWGHWLGKAEIYTRYKNLWGEEISFGEKMHILSAGYKANKWNVNLRMCNPFAKNYDLKKENLSQLASNVQNAHTTLFTKFVIITFSLNLDFGKQRQETNKRINNSDTDSGILSGTR